MMNINVSSRKCAVRVAPTCADERITVVVSPEQARVRDAAFEAAYRAAGMEAHLTTLLVEARDAQERLKGDVKSFLFLDRAIVALEKAHAKLGKENEPIYRAAEEAGERWGDLFHHADLLQYWGQTNYGGCGPKNHGLLAIAWAQIHGVYSEIPESLMDTHYAVHHMAIIGRG
jgi:hypothetical protein